MNTLTEIGLDKKIRNSLPRCRKPKNCMYIYIGKCNKKSDCLFKEEKIERA